MDEQIDTFKVLNGIGDTLYASSATAGKTQGIANEKGYMTSIRQTGSGAASLG